MVTGGAALAVIKRGAAVIFGYLAGLALPDLGRVANATGAAKVQKRGAGQNMPTRAEVRAVLARFGEDVAVLEAGDRGQGTGGRSQGSRRVDPQPLRSHTRKCETISVNCACSSTNG